MAFFHMYLLKCVYLIVMERKMVVLVGPGSAMGMDIALKFGKAGFNLSLLGRNVEKLNEYVLKLKAEGISAYPFYADVTDYLSVNNAFEEINKLNYDIDLVIYNAVSRRIKKPSELTAENVVDDFKVSMAGAISCVSAVLAGYKKKGYGNILFTGGGVALEPSVLSSSMSVSKAGLRNYALNLHNELNPLNIYVGIITIRKGINVSSEYNSQKIAGIYYSMYKKRSDWEYII